MRSSVVVSLILRSDLLGLLFRIGLDRICGHNAAVRSAVFLWYDEEEEGKLRVARNDKKNGMH